MQQTQAMQTATLDAPPHEPLQSQPSPYVKMMSDDCAHRLTERIHGHVRDMVSKSRLSRMQQREDLVLVDRSGVVAHELLGGGAFSQVYLVSVPSRSNGVGGHASGNNTFAMKHVKPELLRPPSREDHDRLDKNMRKESAYQGFCLAACELAVEAHLLASLDHPNIIAIRGWAANGVASFAKGCRHDSFFLLLDPLEGTLDQRLASWRESRQHHGRDPTVSLHLQSKQGGFRSRYTKSSDVPPHQYQELRHTPEDELSLHQDKIQICSEIASALAYLHSLHVIYRDLKPNNIGFLHDGRVQLFDFGLSRELPHASVLTEPFLMSGKVGTLRYMSPEIAAYQPYTVSADTYSFAMVAYEILTLLKPFQGWTRDMHSKLVCQQHVRPDVAPLIAASTGPDRPRASRLVRPLIEASWSAVPAQRPTMHMVHEQLRMIHRDCRQYIELSRTEEQVPSCVSVELPPDFEVRKIPNRSMSASTRTTISMSASLENSQPFFFG